GFDTRGHWPGIASKCDGHHGARAPFVTAITSLIQPVTNLPHRWKWVEIAMTLCEPRLGRRRFFDIELEGFHAQAEKYSQLMDLWREETRQRYEELVCQWLDLRSSANVARRTRCRPVPPTI